MYLSINKTRHTVSRRIAAAGTVRYLGVTPEPEEVSGTLALYTNEGYLLREDAVGDYQRHTMVGSVLTLTNAPEPPEPQPPTDEQLAAQARARRKQLLDETDWTQTLDAPIDATTRDAYRVYRQALRDIPEQAGFPREIVWPEEPQRVKAAPDPVDEAVDLLLGGESDA